MKRCVIVGGAKIENYEFVREHLRPDDFLIYCDCGLKHREELGGLGTPSLIVGDFDSHDNPQLSVETIVLPRAKDDTDTFFAAKEGLKRGFTEFLLIGVTGQRFDHTMANLSILIMLEEKGCDAWIVDDCSEMRMLSAERNSSAEIPERYPYFSLLNLTGTAADVSIEGAKFPLSHAEIPVNYQYGVSNEVLPGKTAKVCIGKGRLLLLLLAKE